MTNAAASGEHAESTSFNPFSSVIQNSQRSRIRAYGTQVWTTYIHVYPYNKPKIYENHVFK